MRTLALALTMAGLMALMAACASTHGTSRDDDAPRRLSDADLERACGDARLTLECQHAMSAEGILFTSCECEGEAQGTRGTMRITGTDTSDLPVDATLPVVWDGEFWRLVE